MLLFIPVVLHFFLLCRAAPYNNIEIYGVILVGSHQQIQKLESAQIFRAGYINIVQDIGNSCADVALYPHKNTYLFQTNIY